MDINGAYEVVFDLLEQDSRCPSDYNCIWSGIGIIHLTVTHDNQEEVVVLSSFNWEDYNQSAVALGLQFTLEELKPYPANDTPIASKRYHARLLIESADE